MSKVITVFGATGSQGGSVVGALVKTKEYSVRAITRNTAGEKALKLKEMGVEIVQASMDDPDSLDKALAGSYGVFIVTNFWEHFDEKKEIQQGTNAINACKKANVKHIVFSGLEKVKDIIGKPCPHFDGKGEVEDYLKGTGVPYTIVRYSMYCENFLNAFPFLGYRPAGEGTDGYTITTCMKGEVDVVSPLHMGPAIVSIFQQPDKYQGKTIGLSSDRMTVEEFIEIVSNVVGKKIQVKQISVEEYGKLGFPGAMDLAAMFDFYAKCNPDRDIKLTKELNPTTPSFKTWAAENKANFEIK